MWVSVAAMVETVSVLLSSSSFCCLAVGTRIPRVGKNDILKSNKHNMRTAATPGGCSHLYRMLANGGDELLTISR